MFKTRRSFAGFLCLLAIGASAATRADDDVGHFVSEQGLHRYDGLELRWSALRGRHTHEAVKARELMLVAASDGLHAIDHHGSIRWHLAAGGSVFPPSTDGERLWAGSESGRLFALSRDRGNVLWQRDFPGWVYSPARSGGLIATGGSHGKLWAMDADNGTDRWQLDLGAELVNAPAADAANFYTTTFAAELLAIDAASGEVRWRRQLPAAAGTPQIDAGRLLLRLFDGSLMALSASGGEPLWHHRSRGRALTPTSLLPGNRLLLDEGASRLSLLSTINGRVLAQANYRGALVGRPLWREGAALIHLRSLPGTAPLAQRLPLRARLASLEE